MINIKICDLHKRFCAILQHSRGKKRISAVKTGKNTGAGSDKTDVAVFTRKENGMDTVGQPRTDLAAEARERLCKSGRELAGVEFESSDAGRYSVGRLRILDGRGEKALGKPVGCYRTVAFGSPVLLSEEEKAELSAAIAGELREMMRERKVNFGQGPVLTAGLGNRRMVVDAIGPATVSKITVTNHLKTLDPALYASLGMRATAAFCPGVLGDTGMESAEAVRAVCSLLRPCAVIAVDALAAGSRARLVRAVQLSDAGICPGSGVGNDRPAIDRRTLGVPVFSLGVPTVVDLSTIVLGLAEDAGVDPQTLPAAFLSETARGGDWFVAPKDVDAAVEALGDILAGAIDGAMKEK